MDGTVPADREGGGGVDLADSDADLVARVRSGDTAAFDALFERHRGIARHVAANQTDNRADVDDVVSDAFASVFQSLTSGKGPDTFFRAYLLTTVKRISFKANQAASRTRPTDEPHVLDSVEVHQDPVMAEFESAAVARAFKALPERWQAVLWYVDIEGMKPAAASVMLGLSPNGVSSLALRARERLRQVYLQQHVRSSVGQDCEEYSSQLGVYARNGLRQRSHDRVQAHLDECARCTALLLDLNDVQSAMRAVLFPLVTGVTFTSAVPALSGSGATAVGRGSHAASKQLSLTWKIGVGVLTGAAVVVGAAVAMGVTGSPPVEGPAAASSPTPVVTAPSARPTATPETVPAVVEDGSDPGKQDQEVVSALPGKPSAGSTKAGSPKALPLLPDVERPPAALPVPSASPGVPVLPLPPTVPGDPGSLPPLLPTQAPTPGPSAPPLPSVTATPQPEPEVNATFRTEAGTTASDVNAFITFDLGGATPSEAEAVFTVSEGSHMIPGKLVVPDGWSCTKDPAATRQFHCVSTTVDSKALEFALGVTRKGPTENTTLEYQISGTGIGTTAFSNTF
ncbi:sigma-70 family RNA polymerase sigma factor [Paenarthrobacter sp. GOM3]|uniref:sigma-70 family RNA polymerase sigma factor n=1 Tax=Paenarthrobacter sp. GOM3 TaxID=2782567 RepID=UPI001BAA889E|nr:sigma-70 family RNA polymerase sigma factor [Paenarthrobacter sp. GOM3]WOH16968.1 sigma-70 family RNA polymerase sigma factor [Paenarthrobacter sp. GOM3]